MKWLRLPVSVVCAVLVAGGVFAAAAGPNGSFEGYPVVRVMVNGQSVQGDVPAINFGGRTMVPVRFVSEALGAEVGWDQQTWTASVMLQSAAQLRQQLDASQMRVTQLEAELARLNPPTPPQPSRGISRADPGLLGDVFTILVDDLLVGEIKIELELVQVVSGQPAWSMISAANMFNEAPAAGQEYISAKFRVKIVQIPPGSYWSPDGHLFWAVSASGVTYDRSSVVEPNPDLDADLYQGAEHTGWISFLVNTTDANPVVVFDRGFSGGGTWFKLRP